MKNYDFKAAKRYVQIHSDLIAEVSLGMKEDWFWTAETVYSDEKFMVELDRDGLTIAGISGSNWATPVMQVVFKDGTELFKDCFVGESDTQKPAWFSLGVLSGPVQEEIDRQTAVPKLTQ